MAFLWNLLPGAREARNDLIVGYAWLIAIGLWTGVAPELLKSSHGIGPFPDVGRVANALRTGDPW
jgi:hypothetical protein